MGAHVLTLYNESVHLEFRKVQPEPEMRSLLAFDRKVFRASDRFDAEYWSSLESYWMVLGAAKVGCCGFEKNVDFQGDLRSDDRNPRMQGSLYIATSGIHPRFQRQGFGRMLKSFEICYARRNRFRRVVTNMRAHNTPMIRLNQEFGFRVTRTTAHYYYDPVEPTVVMELALS